jgi:hypothetical protein
MMMFMHVGDLESREDLEEIAAAIEFSLFVDSAGGTGGAGAAPDGFTEYTSVAGYGFAYPEDWVIEEVNDVGYLQSVVVVSPGGVTEDTAGDTEFMVIGDYTGALLEWEDDRGAMLESFVNEVNSAFGLTDLLGEPNNAQWYDETDDGEYFIREMTAAFGSTSVHAQVQIDYTLMKAQAACSVGLTDETIPYLQAIIESLESR